MISDFQWQVYKNTINKANNLFNQDIIIWKRFSRGFQRYGEDSSSNEYFDDISLKCLIAYNVFRSWPMTKDMVSGALDKESLVLILNKDYLGDNGYLNSSGFFQMDPGKDYFIHRGKKYRSSGETEVAQANDEPVLFYLILEREEIGTGESKY